MSKIGLTIIIIIKTYHSERNPMRAMRMTRFYNNYNTRFGGSRVLLLLLSTSSEDNRRVGRWFVTVRKLIHSRTRRPAKGLRDA